MFNYLLVGIGSQAGGLGNTMFNRPLGGGIGGTGLGTGIYYMYILYA